MRGSVVVAARALVLLMLAVPACLSKRPPAEETLTDVDLLFVVDNGNSMPDEQDVLRAQVDLLLDELLFPTPFEDLAGAPSAVESLHVGVVTTDMGTGGVRVMGCSEPDGGDHGVLQNEGRLDGCASTYRSTPCSWDGGCPWLDESSWEDLGCLSSLGTDGCGFEQPLEASLAALTEQLEPGAVNEGFLREESLLVIVYVTDEDDCSAADSVLFDTNADLGPLNTRCAVHEGRLHPVSRYVEGLRGLREDAEDRLIVAGIVGIPVDGRWSPGDSLADIRALVQVDPVNSNELVPTCETAMGLAYAPPRIVELAYELGGNGYLESICRDDWSPALTGIARLIQRRMDPSYFSR